MNNYYKLGPMFVCLLTLGGCGVVMGTAISTVRSGQSDLVVVKPIQDFQSYTSVSLNPIGGPVDKQLTPEMLAHLNNKIHEELTERGANFVEDGELCISGTVLRSTDGFRNKEISVQFRLERIETRARPTRL